MGHWFRGWLIGELKGMCYETAVSVHWDSISAFAWGVGKALRISGYWPSVSEMKPKLI